MLALAAVVRSARTAAALALAVLWAVPPAPAQAVRQFHSTTQDVEPSTYHVLTFDSVEPWQAADYDSPSAHDTHGLVQEDGRVVIAEAGIYAFGARVTFAPECDDPGAPPCWEDPPHGQGLRRVLVVIRRPELTLSFTSCVDSRLALPPPNFTDVGCQDQLELYPGDSIEVAVVHTSYREIMVWNWATGEYPPDHWAYTEAHYTPVFWLRRID